MSPEEVARIHQFREGFTLVDYAEIGLPVFRLTIEAITTSYRLIPTIQEFIMRGLSLGIEHEDDIARMLGLKIDVVQAATNMLVTDTFVARQAAPPDRESFRLTEAGEVRLDQEKVEELKEETRREQLDAEMAIRSVHAAAQGASRNAPASVALREAQERFGIAQHVLESMQVRPLACYEQDDLLTEAIKGARRSLIITTAGIQPQVVNGYFLRALDGLAEAGADVRIDTVLTPTTEARGGDHFDPLAELAKRAVRNQLTLTKVPRRELYFLFQDDELAVISNRPFLGEVSRRSGFLRVDGLVTRQPEYVRSIKDALAASETVARRRA